MADVFKNLQSFVMGAAILVIMIFVFSLVLFNLKDMNSYDTALNTSIDSARGYLDDPITWFGIVFIIAIVAWLIVYLKGKTNSMK